MRSQCEVLLDRLVMRCKRHRKPDCQNIIFVPEVQLSTPRVNHQHPRRGQENDHTKCRLCDMYVCVCA
eukprot:scaffold662917_cov59-Prasinocladus_malaysianus.AAC.1